MPRRRDVRFLSSLALVSSAILLASCGGGGGAHAFGELTGNVFDESGNPVRNARVFIDGADHTETVANSFGSFRLAKVGIGQGVTVRAEITQGVAKYSGVNVATVNEGARTQSLNITVYPTSQLATLTGSTFDRSGSGLFGVRVFARPRGTGILSSAIAISDKNGNFRLEGLRSDQDYDLISNARGYGDATDTFRLAAGETRNIIVTLGNPVDTQFAPPTALSAVVWTSPREVSRDAKTRNAAEGLKREIDPKRAARHAAAASAQIGVKKGRDTASGDPIETELVWTGVTGSSLLGYGVYRSESSTGTSQNLINIDLLRDPLAEIYTDSDPSVVEEQTYTYALTSLSTSYPDTTGSESGFSTTATVTTLGSQDGGVVSTRGGAIRFDWVPALGATRTAVFVFDQYPGLGVTSRFNTFDAPSTSSSYVYAGPALSSGQTYYYLLLGLNADGSSRAISPVGSFVAP